MPNTSLQYDVVEDLANHKVATIPRASHVSDAPTNYPTMLHRFWNSITLISHYVLIDDGIGLSEAPIFICN